MEQPAKDRLDDHERRIKKLEEQQTEPIKTPPYFQYQLSNVQENVTIIKVEMQEARADILNIRESQADLRDRLIEHGQRLESIETKQDAQTEILGQLMNVGESHIKRFDQLQSSVDSMKSTQEQILRLLQERR